MSWKAWHEEDDENENEEEEEEINEPKEKDSLIFLVDSRLEMFRPMDDQGNTPFHNTMQCINKIYCSKIISSNTDLMGTVFFGTKEKNNPMEFEHIYAYHDLDLPDAQRIKDIQSFIDDEKKFVNSIGHCTTRFNMHEALWACQYMFSHVTNKSVGYKRIFIFTNDDNPIFDDPTARKKSVERAKIMNEAGITMELFVIKKHDAQFDASKFWEHVIGRDEEEYTGKIIFDQAERLSELQDKVKRKEYKKRAYGSIPLELGPGVTLGVSVYNLVHKASKSSYTYVNSENNRPLKTETKYVCANSGAELMPSDIKQAFDYGGEQVVFDKEEIKKIKNFGPPGLKLLGFKPRSKIKEYMNIKPSSFIYPDDKSYTGSTTALAALHLKMLEKDRVAICRLILRSGVMPRNVALIPQREIVDEDGSQIQPPGFNMLYIPYADEIRNLRLDDIPRPEVSEKELLKTKKLVKRLNIQFDSNDFVNPALQKHYAGLQALALDQNHVDEIPDYTMPDEEGMRQYESLVAEFRAMVFPDNYDPEALVAPKTAKRAPKRTKTETEDDDEDEEPSPSTSTSTSKGKARAPPKKKVKREVKSEDDDDDNDGESAADNWKTMAENGTLTSLTVAELKDFLRKKKLPLSGKKADLVERITNYFQKHK